MTFSFIFIGVVPVLLGYYHLGRLGFLLNVAAGFALAWIMAVCGMLCFAFVGYLSGSAWLSTVAYAACLALVYILIARFHLRSARSTSLAFTTNKIRSGTTTIGVNVAGTHSPLADRMCEMELSEVANH
jgi:hypothetical protein